MIQKHILDNYRVKLSPSSLLAGLARAFATAGLLTISGAVAADVVVTVLDREGAPVPNVAVYMQSPQMQAGSEPGRNAATMDQRDKQFVPHLLVVQTGTSVNFPNSDVIAHHVYSFSHPNHFKLPIYKGEAYPPVAFDESGVVVLGCNIHDNMLGYILVVDTPVFAKTDMNGMATLPADNVEGAQVVVWSPRIRDDAAHLSVSVASAEESGRITFQLAKSLRPSHDHQGDALSWTDY
jgi:plastocyanin